MAEANVRKIMAMEERVLSALSQLDEMLNDTGVAPLSCEIMGECAVLREPLHMISGAGERVPSAILERISSIGTSNNLPSDWLADSMARGGTTMSDMEWATGPLQFRPAWSGRWVTAYRMDMTGAIRIRVAAADTAISSGNPIDAGLISEIRALCEYQGLDSRGLRDLCSEWVTDPDLIPSLGIN